MLEHHDSRSPTKREGGFLISKGFTTLLVENWFCDEAKENQRKKSHSLIGKTVETRAGAHCSTTSLVLKLKREEEVFNNGAHVLPCYDTFILVL